MNEFNLIPEDYQRLLTWYADLRRSAIALGLVAIILITSAAALHELVTNKQGEIATLQNKHKISEQQRNEITFLSSERDELQSYLDFLVGLRGGVAAPEMLMSVDRAFEKDDVWFRSWDFQRAGFAVAENEVGQSNGYFIVAPQRDGAGARETWKIETHMNVRGQAIDHAALSRFVGELYKQAEVNDVRILDTALDQRASFVDFNMIITVDNSTQGRT